MSGADQRRLSDWTELLHHATPGTGSNGGSCTMATAIDPNGPTRSPPGLRPVKAGHRQDIDKPRRLHGPGAADGDLRNEPGHLRQDARQLRVQQSGPDRGVPLAVPPDRQRQQGGACVSNALDMVHTIDKYYAEQFA